MLITATKWIRETFEKGSRPSRAEVQEWVESGAVPGKVIADKTYVDADRFALGQGSDVERPSGVELLG